MKRLVFCLDGTWNRIDAAYATNVLFTAESVIPIAPDGVAQLIYYDEGVGTARGERLRGGAFGAGQEKNLNDAYRFLVFNHTPGDEIYLFGFSRGAFTARSFAGLIARCGILGRGRIHLVNSKMDRYFARGDNDSFELAMRPFRAENCPDVCVSQEEDDWRAATIAGYQRRSLLSIRYVGVWDTVGSRGIPKYILGSSLANRKYEFHDCDLSQFVHAARHAVAIDEYKIDFEPTLWENLHILNGARGFAPHAHDAPYQQVWFPGNHGSVGGGGDIRGLSDQALDWIWDGAQAAGLHLDLSEHSCVYTLNPRDTDPLINRTPKPGFDPVGWFFDKLPKRDRKNGPSQLFQLSPSTRRRWHIDAQSLPERRQYRPRTLDLASAMLGTLTQPGSGWAISRPPGSSICIASGRTTRCRPSPRATTAARHRGRMSMRPTATSWTTPSNCWWASCCGCPACPPSLHGPQTPSSPPLSRSRQSPCRPRQPLRLPLPRNETAGTPSALIPPGLNRNRARDDVRT